MGLGDWMLSEELAGDIVAVSCGGSCMIMLGAAFGLQDGVPGLRSTHQ